LRSAVGGEAIAPPSKSYTHRAIILGALTGDKCEVRRPLISEDTAATVSAVAMLGAQIEVENGLIRIECPTLSAPRKSINARNSGTTLRLISGIASLIAGKTSITGDESLRKRPM
jgi:3-phosphoshikimate 1-carboxyvinyltransferase